MFRRPSSVISHQSSASVTTIHTYQSFQSCEHRFLCTDSFKYVQSGKVVDRSIICGEFPIHSSLPWFMVRIRHPSSVKIAPGPILTDDGWRTTDDGLGVNGLSYFLSERFWLKRTTDDWSGRRMVWRTGVNGAFKVVSKYLILPTEHAERIVIWTSQDKNKGGWQLFMTRISRNGRL